MGWQCEELRRIHHGKLSFATYYTWSLLSRTLSVLERPQEFNLRAREQRKGNSKSLLLAFRLPYSLLCEQNCSNFLDRMAV